MRKMTYDDFKAGATVHVSRLEGADRGDGSTDPTKIEISTSLGTYTIPETGFATTIISARRESADDLPSVAVHTPDGGWAELPAAHFKLVKMAPETKSDVATRRSLETRLADLQNAVVALAARVDSLDGTEKGEEQIIAE